MKGRLGRVSPLLLHILFPLGSLLLALWLLFRRLLSPGYVIYRDLFPGQLYYPSLWHPQGSFLALENYKFVTFTGIFLPLRALGLDVYEKAVYVGAAAVAYLAFYLAAFRLLNWFGLGGLSLPRRHLVSALGALAYLANPAAANIFFDFSLFVGYAFAPLSLLLFVEMLEGRRRPGPTIILLAALWWVSAIKAHWIVFGQCLFLPPLLVWVLSRRHQHERRRLWRNLLATAAITGCYLLFSAYWLIPFVGASQQRFVGSYAPITRDSIAFLSYTPLYDTVRLLGSFSAWPYVRFESPAPWLGLPWTLATWAIPVAAVSALVWFRRRWQVWFLFLFVLAGVLLAKGVAPPLGGLYEGLVFGLVPESFRWLFRVASKWNVFVGLGYCGLVTLFLGELLSRLPSGRPFRPRLRSDQRSGLALLALGGYLCAFVLVSWPSFSGDFRGALQPVPLPEPLLAANDWLAQQEGDFKVNWMPVTNGRELDWNRRPSGDLYTSLSARPSIGTNWNRHPVLYYSYIYESLADGQVAHLGKLLAMLNTRFLAYHDDVVSGHVHDEVEPVSVLIEGLEQSLVEQLAAQQDLRLAWQDDFITLYESLEVAPHLFVPQRVFWTAGDLSLLTSLDALVEFQPSQEAVLFDTSRPEGTLPLEVDGLLLGHDAADHVDLALLPAERLLAPAEATDRDEITAAWSRFDVYQFDWQSVLRTHGIDYWGFDYGQGVVAHSTKVQLYGLPADAATSPQLDLEVDVPTTGSYILWVRYLRQEQGGEVLVSIDGESLAVLRGQDPITRFVWEEIGPLQLAGGRHRLRLQNRDGFSVVNVMALVSEEEMASLRARRRALVDPLPQIYLFELEKDFVGPVEPVPDMTRFSSGRAVSLDAGETVSTTLELLSPADYWLALRAFVPAGAGPLTATLGTTLQTIPPPTTTADLAWLVTGPVHLAAGRLPVQLQAAGEVVLDALMLYTGEAVTTPEALFESVPPPAEISYEQVEPTRYRVLVRAQRPFVLALAETYDPLWVASTADMRVSSIPLGGTVNGFFIDKTGSYELSVEYVPQQWARLGRLLTLLALVVAVPLAVFLQRRREA